jgi:NTE family protein
LASWSAEDSMKLGLVLGAGGLGGMAYHAGVLHALEEVAGVVAGEASLIVGTSAGAVVGAYLRNGWTARDFWSMALAPPVPTSVPGLGHLPVPPAIRPLSAVAERVVTGMPPLLVPAFSTPCEGLRRGLGSAWVLSRLALRVPLPPLPRVLQHWFPGGMFGLEEGRARLEQDLDPAWPEAPLWLCAFDIVSGRRVVLGRDPTSAVTVPQAVLASSAIPGLYPPVRVGRRVLVDGGCHSCTNLDLAVGAGCDVIVAVAPMAYDTSSPPGWAAQLVRRWPARSLARERREARRAGTKVLMVRPTGAEIRTHALNLMRGDGLDRIAMAAYEVTTRALATEAFSQVLGRPGRRRGRRVVGKAG